MTTGIPASKARCEQVRVDLAANGPATETAIAKRTGIPLSRVRACCDRMLGEHHGRVFINDAGQFEATHTNRQETTT